MKELFDEFGHGSLSRLPTHRNPGLEIVYLRHGHLVWHCNGRQEAVRPDSFFFTLPWQEHGSVLEFEPGHEWYFAVIRLTKPNLNRPGPFDFPPLLGFDASCTETIRRLLMKAPRHSWPATPLSRLLLPTLVNELNTPGPLHESRVIHLTSQLILELARIISQPETAQQTQNASRFSTLLADLNRNCDEPWTLAQMAARLKLKRTQFGTLFRHYTGDAPIHYLNRLRINKARRLLQETAKSITDIAFECGYSSSQQFADIFKRFTGTNASQYRRHGPPQLQLPRRQEWTAG